MVIAHLWLPEFQYFHQASGAWSPGIPIAIYKPNSVTASPEESPGLLTELPPKLLSNSSALLTSTLLTALLKALVILVGNAWGHVGASGVLVVHYFCVCFTSVKTQTQFALIEVSV